ncbi:class I SAM-dependent methyltransferase [Nocardioides sp. R-C-SC26]|uniref:class I SAM-dependent methyltransferase n=1 Tax=Nocardioides sp. R-C-SC26 TaxID=2870414 RepID=UPI001E419B6D|nr:class I SAM-dependent methyltransferase [Nocardioides sp. R-C-SC26]
MSEDFQRRALSFGGVADAYHRGRPSYPAESAAWLAGTEPCTVLELGAGTGKLTADLLALGHDVYATEPDEEMLAVLRAELPQVHTSASGAEEIPLPDESVDVVVAAQCFHWFDPERALPEIARVLKPGGTLALVWHRRDERIPWVKKLGRIIGTQENNADLAASVLDTSPYFGEIARETFKFWQVVDRRSIVDLALSRSNIAVLGQAQRDRVVADLLALYDDYGRGMDGMQLPYLTECYRTTVVQRPVPPPEPERPLFASDDPDARPQGDDVADSGAGSGDGPGADISRDGAPAAPSDTAGGADEPAHAGGPLSDASGSEPSEPSAVERTAERHYPTTWHTGAGRAMSAVTSVGGSPVIGGASMTDTAATLPRVLVGSDDTATVLIDFR